MKRMHLCRFASAFSALCLLAALGIAPAAHAARAGEGADLQAASTPALTAQQLVPNDPEANQASGRQRAALALGNVYEAWSLARADGQVTIAVLDSGCDLAHPDLADNTIAEAAYNALDGSADVTDADGHGTHVAGIAAARAGNGLGVAGVSHNARILPVKVVNDTGSADSYAIARGLSHVAKCAREHPEYNIRVVNLSVGGKGSASDEGDAAAIRAMEELHNLGILVVCAAGNTDAARGEVPPYRAWPGDFSDNVLSIMNASDAETRASGSNYNTNGQMTKRICAPGTGIYSTVPNGTRDGGPTDFGYKSGTSMASPFASGVAALVFAANPSLGPDEVTSILCSTASDMGAPGFDGETGFGMVNAASAVRAATTEAHLSGARSLLAGQATRLSPSLGKATDYTWQSSDTNVAIVDETGTVTGMSSGYAIVTAQSGNALLPQVVSVREAAIRGESQLTVGNAAGWNVSSSLPDIWTWTSSDVKIATVSASGRVRGIAPGVADITARLSSNPAMALTQTVTVAPATIDLAMATISAIPAQSYTGSPLTPRPSVVLDGATLVHGEDYRLTYANNIEPGTASVSIEGIGGYSGTISASFEITQRESGAEAPSGGEGTNDDGQPASNEADNSGTGDGIPPSAAASKTMLRLYNPNSGEHFFTASAEERDMLIKAGWRYEGRAWTAPEKSNTPVYRLYNPNEPLGDHHYTTSKAEYDHLIIVGWRGEGIGWYSDDGMNLGLHRLYNPNAYASGLSGAHHYTVDDEERRWLVSLGWEYEGIGWHGLGDSI